MNRVIYLLLFIAFCINNSTIDAQNNTSNNNTSIKIKNFRFSRFKSTDIGIDTLQGLSIVENKQLKVKASGADIWGTNDGFHFNYRKIKGDFDIRVNVVSLSKAHLYTKAGIMARADLSDDSPHVYFQVFPDNSARNKNNGGCEFQYRMEKGGEMKAIYPNTEIAGNKFDVNFPDTWIRLKREGNIYTSFISNDNKSWHLYSRHEQVLPEELVFGLAVTAHNSAKYTEAVFSKLELGIAK